MSRWETQLRLYHVNYNLHDYRVKCTNVTVTDWLALVLQRPIWISIEIKQKEKKKEKIGKLNEKKFQIA